MIKELKIINKLGLHARASSKLVEITNKFESEIFIEFNSVSVNAKSILGLLSLAIPFGSNFHINIKGIDEEEALIEIENLIKNKFGESE
jgi:phosphocarrier protein|tara:strand:+ start:360 stop:626 length:267 start_codon:yes stop_codon:yes gene_type:complete